MLNITLRGQMCSCFSRISACGEECCVAQLVAVFMVVCVSNDRHDNRRKISCSSECYTKFTKKW
jgi:hypothetical protein